MALSAGPPRTLELPAVTMISADGESERFNLTFFWSRRLSAIVALAHRSESQTALELELSRQIRARLMAEGLTEAKSRELARANADLEDFAAIVSHDLKAPVRRIHQLASNADAALGVTASELRKRLEQIAAQADRMSQMLERLFDYSTLGRKYEALDMVDFGEIVRSIVTSSPPSGIAVEVTGDWPIFPTLRAPLDLALRNLIANALQHHDREYGHVRVACADSQDAVVITVADDGPGIAPQHHRAIFLPFRTIATSPAPVSTGMGLALVDRAVTSIGGAVTLASNPALERGALFAIQWPKVIVERD
ncbi:MAG: sensor histidine kinase [Hyphomicrobium sp.]